MAMHASDLGHALFEILETGDPALAAEVVHDEFHNREAAVSPPACRIPGPSGVLASGAWMRFAFSDLRLPVTDTVTSDSQVWVRLRMQGRHTGAFVLFNDQGVEQVVPPTGREIDFEQIHVLDLRDGKVVRHEAVRDDITMLGQLGVFPPGPAAGMRMLSWRLTGRAARAASEVSARAAEAAAALPQANTV
ncbi:MULTISPECIES: ester cyclase [Streptomyces]|uniref:ester cyclase n=1 Tax=Streptomyces TaxID=1883 RepID=UPI0004BDB607|nr:MULTISPECIES: ester cyclase [unclassified Streptomyces]MBG7696720.1 ester cyclase [Streptomyces sp. MC1]